MYPTPKQILKRRVKFRKATILEVKRWKRMWFDRQWSTHPFEVKIGAIAALLAGLSEIYNKPVNIAIAPTDHYNSAQQTIYLSKPSIITALHEFSHHINGHSELTACRWSVWLFRKCFQRQYHKLSWDGHMLCKSLRAS